MNTTDSRRWWALIAIAASVLVVSLDLTVLSLALPVLSTQLHASTSDLQWFSAVYSLVLAAALLRPAWQSVLRMEVGGQGDGHRGALLSRHLGPLLLANQRGRAAAVGALAVGGLARPYGG